MNRRVVPAKLWQMPSRSVSKNGIRANLFSGRKRERESYLAFGMEQHAPICRGLGTT